jgi:hypothetical protein
MCNNKLRNFNHRFYTPFDNFISARQIQSAYVELNREKAAAEKV